MEDFFQAKFWNNHSKVKLFRFVGKERNDRTIGFTWFECEYKKQMQWGTEYRPGSAATSGSEGISSLGLLLPDQPEQACFSRKLPQRSTSEQKTLPVRFRLLQLSFPSKKCCSDGPACVHARMYTRTHSRTHGVALLTFFTLGYFALRSIRRFVSCDHVSRRRDAESVQASLVIHSANSLTFGAVNDGRVFSQRRGEPAGRQFPLH